MRRFTSPCSRDDALGFVLLALPCDVEDHAAIAEVGAEPLAADAGVTPRVVASESGLEFLPVRTESYDLCVAAELLEDRRFRALLRVLQSPRYRRLMGDVPGHQAAAAGELR